MRKAEQLEKMMDNLGDEEKIALWNIFANDSTVSTIGENCENVWETMDNYAPYGGEGLHDEYKQDDKYIFFDMDLINSFDDLADAKSPYDEDLLIEWLTIHDEMTDIYF